MRPRSCRSGRRPQREDRWLQRGTPTLAVLLYAPACARLRTCCKRRADVPSASRACVSPATSSAQSATAVLSSAIGVDCTCCRAARPPGSPSREEPRTLSSSHSPCRNRACARRNSTGYSGRCRACVTLCCRSARQRSCARCETRQLPCSSLRVPLDLSMRCESLRFDAAAPATRIPAIFNAHTATLHG